MPPAGHEARRITKPCHGHVRHERPMSVRGCLQQDRPQRLSVGDVDLLRRRHDRHAADHSNDDRRSPVYVISWQPRPRPRACSPMASQIGSRGLDDTQMRLALTPTVQLRATLVQATCAGSHASWRRFGGLVFRLCSPPGQAGHRQVDTETPAAGSSASRVRRDGDGLGGGVDDDDLPGMDAADGGLLPGYRGHAGVTRGELHLDCSHSLATRPCLQVFRYCRTRQLRTGSLARVVTGGAGTMTPSPIVTRRPERLAWPARPC